MEWGNQANSLLQYPRQFKPITWVCRQSATHSTKLGDVAIQHNQNQLLNFVQFSTGKQVFCCSTVYHLQPTIRRLTSDSKYLLYSHLHLPTTNIGEFFIFLLLYFFWLCADSYRYHYQRVEGVMSDCWIALSCEREVIMLDIGVSQLGWGL